MICHTSKTMLNFTVHAVNAIKIDSRDGQERWTATMVHSNIKTGLLQLHGLCLREHEDTPVLITFSSFLYTFSLSLLVKVRNILRDSCKIIWS